MTSAKTCIIDYGVGNLQSIRNAIKSASGQDLDLVSSPEDLRLYDKFLLPGVGSFGNAITVLRERGLDQAVLEQYRAGKHLLGICVGMQILAEKGLEHGSHLGLGIIRGTVAKLTGEKLSIHMGWNDIHIRQTDPLLRNVADGTDFYFVHGYAFEAEDSSAVVAECNYGRSFPAIVRQGNVWGVQFHPEKSQQQGLNILKNFVEMEC